MKEHGTRIIIYNLWEDDQGLLELDFDTDPHVRVFFTVILICNDAKAFCVRIPDDTRFVAGYPT